jgi:hypothetical protein
LKSFLQVPRKNYNIIIEFFTKHYNTPNSNLHKKFAKILQYTQIYTEFVEFIEVTGLSKKTKSVKIIKNFFVFILPLE